MKKLTAAPSKEAVVKFLNEEEGATQDLIVSFFARVALIGGGIYILGKGREHILRNSIAASTAIELYLLWYYRRQMNVQQNPKVAKSIVRDSKGRKIPQKYLAGYKGKRLEERKKEIEQRRNEYQDALETYGDEDNFPKQTLQKLYRPFKTDQGVKDKRSSYTVEAKRRGFKGSISEKASQASEYYGGKIPIQVLKEVNARGMAAWASGGHRPGQTSHSWGVARVNSFLVGGKTFFTADKDLASKLPKKVQSAIKKQRHWKG